MCNSDCPLRPGCGGECIIKVSDTIRTCSEDCPLRPACGGRCVVTEAGAGRPGMQLALPAPPRRPALLPPPSPPHRAAIPMPAPGSHTPPLPAARTALSENSLQKVHQLVAYFSGNPDGAAADGETEPPTQASVVFPDDSLSQMPCLPAEEAAAVVVRRPAEQPADARRHVAPTPQRDDEHISEVSEAEASVTETAASDDDLSDAETHGTDRMQRALQHLSSKLTVCLTEIKQQQTKVQTYQREKARLDGLARRAAEKLAVEEAKLRRLKEKGQRRTGKLKTALDEMNAMP